MTPKEKAIELISKFQEIETDNTIDGGYTFYKIDYEAAIKCAIIAVQEITELATWVDPNLVNDYPKEYTQEDTYEFWNEVYKELERL